MDHALDFHLILADVIEFDKDDNEILGAGGSKVGFSMGSTHAGAVKQKPTENGGA